MVALLTACASYDGRGLVPGQSRAEDVQSLMGAPTAKVAASGDDTLWFYSRNPSGFHSYAVRIGADGVMRSIEQRLTVENMQKLRAGTTTAGETRELLGPPWRVAANARLGGESWDYRMYDATQQEHNLSVQFGANGVVRQVVFLRELVNEPCGM
jgi:outer membrane protein assembly factor BamE (lipoprotein component of BamABCDE complex)